MSAPRKLYGLKMLREDGGSMNDEHQRIIYPLGKWITAPGNGAYIAVSGGLAAVGVGPVLALFECQQPTGVNAPDGVTCFRRVRMLSRCASAGPWARYQKAIAPLYADYQKARAPLYADYRKALDALYADYQKARATLDADYRKACAALDADYQKACDALYADYQKACAKPWRTLMNEARNPKGGK